MSHTPVLLKEIIEILNPQPAEFFIDGTLGSAGHAVEIIKRISPNGMFLGIDWDSNAIENFKLKAKNLKLKTIVVHGNYADLPEILEKNKLPKADGLLLDLGMSSEQLEHSGRGFSFLRNELLDMRYQFQEVRPPRGSTSQILTSIYEEVEPRKIETAAEVVNNFSETELADIFFQYGEEKFSRRIAKKIVEERRKRPIKTTFDLVEIIQKAISFHRSRLHPATKVFQALRIYVNNELDNLEKLLKNLGKIIKNKGRIAIISYHSLEDRLVKNYFREMARQGKAKILTKKPIRPTLEEIRQNPRARSAKLRAITM